MAADRTDVFERLKSITEIFSRGDIFLVFDLCYCRPRSGRYTNRHDKAFANYFGGSMGSHYYIKNSK